MQTTVLILLGALVMAACSPTEEAPVISNAAPIADTVQDLAPAEAGLAGQVYFYAPELDTLECMATGACDCCSGHLLFINGNVFIEIDYCEAVTSYHTGRYRYAEGRLEMVSDSLCIHQDDDPGRAPGEAPAGSEITDTLLGPYSQTAYRKTGGQAAYFVMHTGESYIVTPDKRFSMEKMISDLKSGGIWDRLKLGLPGL